MEPTRLTRRAVSPEMAFRLARLFGNSAEFWLNAQRAMIR
jgi:antitoxin HigA-1